MRSYFEKRDWLTGIFAFGTMLAAYVSTMAPTITLEMAGPLAVGAEHLGIGKFPGFPVWHMVGHVFTRIFSFVDYGGRPNPAWAINFMSAFFGAAACGMIALIVSRLSREIEGHRAGVIDFSAAISAATLFGFTPVMWSQSVIAETHALTTFCLVSLLAYILYWQHTQRRNSDLVVLFAMGLSFSTSQIMILMAPAVIMAAALIRRSLASEIALPIVLLAFVATTFMAITTYATTAAFVVIWLLLVTLVMKNAGSLRRCIVQHACLFAGLLPYAYLPIASDLNPPINMGYARTWQGFFHLIGRGQYEHITPLNPFLSADIFMEQAAWLASDVAYQYVMPTALIGLIPLIIWPRLRSQAMRQLLIIATAAIGFFVLTIIGFNDTPHDIQTVALLRRYLLPVLAIWAIFIGLGFVVLFAFLSRKTLRASCDVSSTNHLAD